MDDHGFEDKFLYYRFFVDEDAKYKQFWVSPGTPRARAVPRWRFRPRVACNSSIASVLLVDHLHDALNGGDPATFVSVLGMMRLRARLWAEDASDWRPSRCVNPY